MDVACFGHRGNNEWIGIKTRTSERHLSQWLKCDWILMQPSRHHNHCFRPFEGWATIICSGRLDDTVHFLFLLVIPTHSSDRFGSTRREFDAAERKEVVIFREELLAWFRSCKVEQLQNCYGGLEGGQSLSFVATGLPQIVSCHQFHQRKPENLRLLLMMKSNHFYISRERNLASQYLVGLHRKSLWAVRHRLGPANNNSNQFW